MGSASRRIIAIFGATKTMIGEVWRALRWNISLGAKIVRVVPWLTLLLVWVALVSQIAMLLASFLPLKVVILLGSENIPSYLPNPLKALGRDLLIGLFSSVTVGFYILHLLAEKLVEHTTKRATTALLLRSHKLVLFERQDEVAGSAYQRFSRALAGGVFIALAFLGMTIVYPKMAIVIVGYLIACICVCWVLGTYNSDFRNRLDAKLGPTLNLFAGTGFFASFGFMVVDFIFLSPPGVISAIVSLLLTRMIMLKIVSGTSDLASLYSQQSKLDALFFHGKVLVPKASKAEQGIWSLIQPEMLPEWLEPLLKEHVQSWQGRGSIKRIQSGLPNVIYFLVQGQCNRYFLVKLFDSSRRSLSLHEATLTIESLQGLPAPLLVANTQVEEYQCLIYQLNDGRQPQREEAKLMQEKILGGLLSVLPPAQLALRYARSRPMLWQRLGESHVKGLALFAEQAGLSIVVNQFFEKCDLLREHLRDLPLVVVNPDINLSSIFISAKDTLLLNWGRWSLDPVGSGWRDGPKQLEQLKVYFERAAEMRADLGDVLVESVELAALTHAFEAKCARQLYSEAIDLLPGLLDRLEAVSNPQPRPVLGAS